MKGNFELGLEHESILHKGSRTNKKTNICLKKHNKLFGGKEKNFFLNSDCCLAPSPPPQYLPLTYPKSRCCINSWNTIIQCYFRNSKPFVSFWFLFINHLLSTLSVWWPFVWFINIQHKTKQKTNKKQLVHCLLFLDFEVSKCHLFFFCKFKNIMSSHSMKPYCNIQTFIQ